MRGLPADQALIDGEAVVLRKDGRSDFGRLGDRREAKGEVRAARLERLEAQIVAVEAHKIEGHQRGLCAAALGQERVSPWPARRPRVDPAAHNRSGHQKSSGSHRHDHLGNTGRKTGFWLEELAAPYYVIEDAGTPLSPKSPINGTR